MAALSASQAPGFLPAAHAAAQGEQQAVTPPPGPQIDGGSPYITDVPPLNTPPVPLAPTAPPSSGGDPVVSVPGSGASLPTTVLDAYQRAQAALAENDPGCHLPWQLLAAIGQVESGQARGGAVDANGTTFKPILGPVLDGNGFADISDTDGGAYDGDPVHDRAVGPMQFIPSTWRTWGADGNGDGVKDPENVYDAALAAADYLCADGRDLAVPHDMDQAILGYNHSQAYLHLVRAWYEHFEQGGPVSVPDRTGTPSPAITPTPPAGPSPTPTAPGSPQPTKTSGGTIAPVPPGGSPSPSAGSGPTGTPTTSPTGGPTTDPATGDPATGDPTTGGPTTEPPTTGDPSTSPTDPPTTPGCPTDSASPTPTDGGTVSPSPTDSPSSSPTPDPCATDSGSPTPSPSDSAGAATGSALTPAS
jgi:membrane-bound lytic murein transglycosylase B